MRKKNGDKDIKKEKKVRKSKKSKKGKNNKKGKEKNRRIKDTGGDEYRRGKRKLN